MKTRHFILLAGVSLAAILSAEDAKTIPPPAPVKVESTEIGEVGQLKIAIFGLQNNIQDLETQLAGAKEQIKTLQQTILNFRKAAVMKDLCDSKGFPLEECVIAADGKTIQRKARTPDSQ